jgi:hypothetical protein
MVSSRLATVLWVLFGSVGLVLLIACSNIANMLMQSASDGSTAR